MVTVSFCNNFGFRHHHPREVDIWIMNLCNYTHPLMGMHISPLSRIPFYLLFPLAKISPVIPNKTIQRSARPCYGHFSPTQEAKESKRIDDGLCCQDILKGSTDKLRENDAKFESYKTTEYCTRNKKKPLVLSGPAPLGVSPAWIHRLV